MKIETKGTKLYSARLQYSEGTIYRKNLRIKHNFVICLLLHLSSCPSLLSVAEAYLETGKTSEIDPFEKVVNGFQRLLNIWLSLSH